MSASEQLLLQATMGNTIKMVEYVLELCTEEQRIEFMGNLEDLCCSSCGKLGDSSRSCSCNPAFDE